MTLFVMQCSSSLQQSASGCAFQLTVGGDEDDSDRSVFCTVLFSSSRVIVFLIVLRHDARIVCAALLFLRPRFLNRVLICAMLNLCCHLAAALTNI